MNAAQQLERLRKETSIERKGEVHIEVFKKTDDVGYPWLVIRVSDNGPGIHRRDFERVFDLFYTTKVHGCGMGLDICRKIAADVSIGNKNGQVMVRRSPFLCGSCIEARLPLSL
jgi:signal transduction histidine kinase